jgi:hypothetical protein
VESGVSAIREAGGSEGLRTSAVDWEREPMMCLVGIGESILGPMVASGVLGYH